MKQDYIELISKLEAVRIDKLNIELMIELVAKVPDFAQKHMLFLLRGSLLKHISWPPLQTDVRALLKVWLWTENESMHITSETSLKKQRIPSFF